MRTALLVAMLSLIPLFAGCFDEGSKAPEVPDVPDVASARPLAAATAAVYTTPGIDVTGNSTEALVIVPAELVPVGGGRYLPVSTFEPTIGSDPEGCLYFTHYRGTGTGTRIYSSCDQGGNWTEIGPNLPIGPVCFPNSNDPYVHVDRDTGRVFSSDLHALISSTLHYTDDKGATWTCNPGGGGTPPGVHDHQTVATGIPRTVQTVGYPNIVYYCVNRVADSVCSSSLDGGIGFGPLIPVFPGVEPPSESNDCTPEFNGFFNCVCGGLHGHVETDHAGRVMLPKGQCGRPEVAVSENDGITWARSVVSASTGIRGHEVRVTADAADNLYAFYIGADDRPYLSLSTNHGATWNTPWMVAPPNVTVASFPAVYGGAAGMVAFAYIGVTHPDGYDADVEELAWNGYIGVMYEALNSTAPTVATVMANDPADPIARRACGNTRCGGLGDFIDMTIDPAGRPWAAFADMCRGDCQNAGATENAGGTVAFAGTFLSGRSLITGQALPVLAATAVPNP